MGKTNNSQKPAQHFNILAQQTQQKEELNLFKYKYPFLKKRAEDCVESLTLQTFQKQFISHPYKHAAFHFDANSFSQPKPNFKGQEEYESQIWTLNGIDTIGKYYRFEDGIQTILLENSYIRNFIIQAFQNSILQTLSVFSSLPFVKGVAIANLLYYEPEGLLELTTKDEELKYIFQDTLKLIARILFQRKSLEEFTLSTNGNISAESFALGLIESIQADNSLRVEKFTASGLFRYLSESTTRQVLQNLPLFGQLKNVDLGSIAISENDTILALNKVLAQVHTAKFNIGEVKQPEKIASLRFGNQEYVDLEITFACDELRNPAAYEELLSRISGIKEVEKLYLKNSFTLNNLEPTRATTTYKTVKDIRRIMPGSSVIEQQYNEGENKDGSDGSFLPVKSFKFFEQLVKVKQTQLKYIGMISRRVVESLVYLLKNGNVAEVNLYQIQLNVNNPLNVPLQLKRVYEQEADIDFSDLYDAFKSPNKKSFTANFKQGNISIVNSSEMTINLPILHQNKCSFPQLFDPLAFSLKTLQKLTITLGKISEFSMCEQIFQQASECEALTFLQVDLTLDLVLRKKAQYDKLHAGSQFGSEKLAQKYLSHLSALLNLKNLVLNIDLDQVIIDSIASFLLSSKSLQTFILRRKQISQYTLDFSQVILGLRKSENITHSLLDLQLENVQISVPEHKTIYDQHKKTTFWIPICHLLYDPACKLTTLQLVLGRGLLKQVEAILKVLLKKRNNTVLVLNYYATYKRDVSSGSVVQMSMAQNLMRIEQTDIQDNQRFITKF